MGGSISVPNYVKEMRHKFQHDRPSRPEHAPCRWNRPTYGPGPQLSEPEDDSPPLDAKGINEIQQVVGSSSLHHGRAIDSTILPALNSISAEQSKAAERTRQDAKKLLDCLATHPDAVTRCVKSDMVLLHVCACAQRRASCLLVSPEIKKQTRRVLLPKLPP